MKYTTKGSAGSWFNHGSLRPSRRPRTFPWRGAESSPSRRHTGGPWRGSRGQLESGLCASQWRDEWAQRSSGWSRWCRCRRASGISWSNPRFHWPEYLKSFKCEKSSSNFFRLILTLVYDHEVWVAVLVDLANSTEQETNASVLKKLKMFTNFIHQFFGFPLNNSVSPHHQSLRGVFLW